MADNTYKFELPTHHKSIIKVIGVGGGGSNAVNHMFNQGIKDVEFIICNTDAQALKASKVPTRLQLGANLTQGLGAGANPEKGKNAAIESKEDIRDMLSQDTKMVFITAGMGGGTGTGAAPIIAKVARELDILTVGIVTAPFAFEGKKKMQQAEQGIKELRENCDTVLVILNDQLREIFGNLTITTAFAQADNVLTTAAKGIAEIITVPGYVNVDFEDVKTVMKNSGAAVMGSATTEGENRARRAAEEALASPLLDNRNILGAQKILLSIVSGEQAELQMDELTDITEFIQEKAGDEAEVIFGHGVDTSLGNKIRVTLIATGFERHPSETSVYNKIEEPVRKVFDLDTHKQIPLFDESSIAPKKEEPIMSRIVPPAPKAPEPVRTYSFEPPKKEEPKNNSSQDFFFGLDEEYEIVEKPTHRFMPSDDEYTKVHKEEDLESKREKLREQARERINKIQSMKGNDYSSDSYRDKFEVPAYLRRNVNLQDVPHSSENNISRYNLNDDNQILGNNRFLHDNVD
ncbi:cell division protein FtsZ [Cytophagales bacterium LB-30]|uniref:Cell division protein FtsZ n=1 Tax=Shiella aurantiaca TaxID=3058365 RepID=A0ABT8F336_9BACT|nr:cell division protein FtsZ [Shiella aurantiaca]MDN4164421.1 cell division protein FtsZ [Shiella aurantiaca]